jgi:hypothetical protein
MIRHARRPLVASSARNARRLNRRVHDDTIRKSAEQVNALLVGGGRVVNCAPELAEVVASLLESAHGPGEREWWHVEREFTGDVVVLSLTSRDHPAPNAGDRTMSESPFLSPAEVKKKSAKVVAEMAEKIAVALSEGHRMVDIPVGVADDVAEGLREAGWIVEVKYHRGNPKGARTLLIADPAARRLPEDDEPEPVFANGMTVSEVARAGLNGGAATG